VALVSDAGTPALNDPGYELVRAVLEAGHPVSPVPGPTAPIAALVASGLPTDAFLYLGYLPRKSSERRRLLDEVASLPYTLIFLETPHRLLAALEDLEAGLGDRQAALARELTKLYEEIFRGPLSAAREHYTAQPPRGEFTLVVAGASPQKEACPEARLLAALKATLAQGLPPSQAASRLAAESGWPRRQVYHMITTIEQKATEHK
jgi:16S rRNA (cytidine1402-2'-O)-methyltransferase